MRLEIEHNLFSGQLPATITNLANLGAYLLVMLERKGSERALNFFAEILYCFDNFLSGALPNNIGQLQQLRKSRRLQ